MAGQERCPCVRSFPKTYPFGQNTPQKRLTNGTQIDQIHRSVHRQGQGFDKPLPLNIGQRMVRENSDVQIAVGGGFAPGQGAEQHHQTQIVACQRTMDSCCEVRGRFFHGVVRLRESLMTSLAEA